MTGKIVLKGNGVTSGKTEGEALVTTQPFNFCATYMQSFMISRPSPIVQDARHELFGQDLRGKVLIFPYSVGSLASGAALLEAIVQRVAPNAIVSFRIEAAVLSGALLAELFFDLQLPIVDILDGNLLEVVDTGDHIKVDADQGIIEVVKK